MEQAPQLEDPNDSSRANGKSGAIELCFRLLLSGRRLDEVLEELASNPNILADGPADAGAGNDSNGKSLNHALDQLLITPGAAHDPPTDHDSAARRRRSAAAEIANLLGSLSDPPNPSPAEDVSPWGGRREDRATDAAPPALGELIGTRRGFAAWWLGALLVCALLIAGGAGAAWWYAQRTAPRPQPAAARAATTRDPVRASLAMSAFDAKQSARRAPSAPLVASPAQPASAPPSRVATPARNGLAGGAAPARSAVVPTVIRDAAAAPAGRRAPPSTVGDLSSLVSRGDALLATGDVTSARLFYLRGAESGSGGAALRLGETFDPSFLEQAGLRQIAGDAKQAAYWYQRARELGARDAELLLKQIEPSTQK